MARAQKSPRARPRQPDQASAWSTIRRDVCFTYSCNWGIINDELIALRSITEDGLLVDKEWKTISHYEPNRYNKRNFLMPDYYGYQILDEGEINIV
ncbi:MAG: hypothetical protein ACOX7B_14730 [Christensenellales bacterium]